MPQNKSHFPLNLFSFCLGFYSQHAHTLTKAKVAAMAFFSKAGSLLRQTAGKHINRGVAGAKLSIFQVIRCMSSSKVFVGGLSYSTDDTSLREAFSQYGDVAEARVIHDRETGRSRGFGFVTYATADAASAAIQALDGQELHGRRVRVNYANDRPRSYGGGGAGFGNSGRFGGYGDGGNTYGGQDSFGSYSAGGGGYAGSGGDGYGNSGGNYGSYPTSGGGGYASGGYGYNAGGGGNYASGGYDTTSGGSNDVGGNYASGNNYNASGSISYESNASAGDSFASSDYDKSEGLCSGEDELGSNNSSNMAGTAPVDGDFRDDDDEPSDYADKRA